MFTINSKTSKTESVVCNHKGCKASIKGSHHGKLYREAINKEWRWVNTKLHYCSKHRADSRVAKAATVKKSNGRPSIMEQIKAPHGAGAVRIAKAASKSSKSVK